MVRLHVQDGDLEIDVDHEETVRRRADAQSRLDALNSPAPTGEIDL